MEKNILKCCAFRFRTPPLPATDNVNKCRSHARLLGRSITRRNNKQNVIACAFRGLGEKNNNDEG